MGHRRTWVQVGPALDSKNRVFPSSIHGGRNRVQMMTPGATALGRGAGGSKRRSTRLPGADETASRKAASGLLGEDPW